MTAMIYTALDRETITDLSTEGGVAFTPAKLTADVTYALIQAIDGVVRFCLEGTAPVADTTGHRLLQDESVEIWGQLGDFLAIDDGGTAKLEITYMGRGGG